ncbi:predicted protein [Naegleria gruberi]|uniref:Predicted protein n=1 Tax=Naegleria gruberi TaxID=5762 RepID=D2W1V3_NAEGR|nr:uncharacterized protein NAEGRDRAFT_75281 [Naegleria gruberi]EFC36982.1 predicted protein [Naegleria gruberi]|eukprot:XP_002669726.1 predicted protein [Naegleria gruberi strain NEG-M]
MKLLAKLKPTSDQNKIIFPNLSKTLLTHELKSIPITNNQLVPYVKAIEFNHDRTLLAISSYEGFIKVFRVRVTTTGESNSADELQLHYTFTIEPKAPIRCLKFINQLKYIVCGTDRGNVHVIDYENDLEVVRVPFGEYVRCLMVHPKYPFIMAGGDNGKILLWNWEKKFAVEHVMSNVSLDPKKYVMSMSMNCFNTDIVISGSLNSTVTVWNIPFKQLSEYRETDSDKSLFKISSKPKPSSKKIKTKSPVNCVDFYRGNDYNRRNWFVASFDDGSTQIFDCDSGECIVKLSQIHPEPVTTCIFEGDFIFSGSEDGLVDMYYTTAGFKHVRKLRATPKVWCIQVDKCVENCEKLRNETLLKVAIGTTASSAYFTLKKVLEEYPVLKINHNPKLFDVEIVTKSSDVLIMGSFKYYMKLAETDAQAQYHVGIMLKNGQDVQQDQREGFQWLLKAAKNDNSLAQFEVGMFFLNTDKNYERAHKWLSKSANNGHDEAQYQMARIFNEGIWVKKDFAQAFDWGYKAAQQHHTMAIQFIIDCFNYGVGVKKNLLQAKLWMEKLNHPKQKFKRFHNAFETFGTEHDRSLIVNENEFCYNPKATGEFKPVGQYLEKDLSTLLTIETEHEKITNDTIAFYNCFLQFNIIQSPPIEKYYQILVSLFELANYLHNDECKGQILKVSNPILRCFLLDKMKLMNSTFIDILHCFIVNEDLKALELPLYLIKYVMNGKNIELFAKWKLLNSGYQYDSPLNDMKIDGNQLLAKYSFNTNKMESFKCIPDFLTIQHKDGEVIISNIISNMRIFIEFKGLENVGYHICMSNANETVKLTPLIEYFEMRGVLSFENYQE